MDDSDNLKGNLAMRTDAEQMKSLNLNINPKIFEQAERISKLQSRFKLPESALASIRTIQKLTSGVKSIQTALDRSGFSKSIKHYSNLSRTLSSAFNTTYSESLQNTLKNYSSSFKVPESFANLHSQLQQFSDTTNVRLSGSLNSIAAARAIAQGHVEAIRNLDSFEALENLKDSPFSADYEDGSFDQYTNSEVSLEDLDDLDTLIKSEIEDVTDFKALPAPTRHRILELRWHFAKALFMVFIVTLMAIQTTELLESFEGANSRQEVKKKVKEAKSKYDPVILAGYRVVIASALNLTSEPNKKAEVLDVLPRGTVMAIKDKTNKAWLLVEVETENESIQGWVSRKYTTYFK